MKFISLLAFSMAISSMSFGQDIQNADADTHVSGIAGTEAAVEISSKIDVVNATDEVIEVGCKREILLQEAEGSAERFCWGGLCFEAGTEVAPLTLDITGNTTILAGDDINGFTGYYNYNGENGVCQIKYTFYEVGNEENNTEVIVNYCVDSNSACQTFLGTEEIVQEEIETSVSPNPATSNFMISYSLNSTPDNGKVVIYNLLGEVVKEMDLTSRMGVLNFSSSDFNTGMYFYSIQNGTEKTGSKRFIIQ